MSSEQGPQKMHSTGNYLTGASIGPTIAKGCALTYKEKPKRPIEFFATWLLKQADI